MFIDSPFNEMRSLMSISYASLVLLRNNPTTKKQRLSKVIPPLACGVPVIFSGHGESADLICEYNCGITIEPENAKLLALDEQMVEEIFTLIHKYSILTQTKMMRK